MLDKKTFKGIFEGGERTTRIVCFNRGSDKGKLVQAIVEQPLAAPSGKGRSHEAKFRGIIDFPREFNYKTTP